MSLPAAGASASGVDRLRRWTPAFLALCLVSFLNSFATAPFLALFPVYVEADLGRVPLFTANLRALMLVLGGIFAVVGGQLCDRWGRKRTLLLGLVGSVVTGLVFRCSEPWILVVLVFVIGVASGPWSTAGQSYLIASVAAPHLGMGSALYFLSNTFGNSLGSLLTGVLKARWSFPRIGLAMTAALLSVFVLALWVLPAGRGQAEERRRARPALWASYRPLLGHRRVHLLMGLRSMVTTFWGMASLLLPLMIYRVSRSESTPAYYAAVSLGVAAVCQVGTGLWRDRCGRFWPLLISTAAVGVSGLGLGLFWQSLACLFAFGTALTSAAWAVSTLMPALINEVAGPEEKNRLVGLGHTVWSGSMVLGNLLGGILIEVRPGLPFYAGAALAAGAVVCGWRLGMHLDRPGA